VRGNGRREVFHGSADCERFLKQLDDAVEKDNVILYAYGLLPNHYHLFIETPHGNVQRFMQRLNTAYSMYHRYKHSQPGHCFQGRYGAKLISGDTYIAALTRYIHLNPAKTAAQAKRSHSEKLRDLEAYRWSSYRGYVDAEDAEDTVDYRWLSLMGRRTSAGNRRTYREYVERGLTEADGDLQAAMGASRYAIGDEEFVGQVESDLRDVRGDRGIYGDIVWPVGKVVSLDAVADAVAAEFGLEPDALMTRSSVARIPKKVAVELGCRHSQESQRKVGEYFGYRGNGSVSKQRDRLRELLDDDKALRRSMKRLEKLLIES